MIWVCFAGCFLCLGFAVLLYVCCLLLYLGVCGCFLFILVWVFVLIFVDRWFWLIGFGFTCRFSCGFVWLVFCDFWVDLVLFVYCVDSLGLLWWIYAFVLLFDLWILVWLLGSLFVMLYYCLLLAGWFVCDCSLVLVWCKPFYYRFGILSFCLLVIVDWWLIIWYCGF